MPLLREACKAELRLIAQRVSCMRRHGMAATMEDELQALGITLKFPWEAPPIMGPRRAMPPGTILRRETTGADRSAVYELLCSTFGSSFEADLLGSLRSLPTHDPALFLVAVADGRVVGHVAFSHVDCPHAARPTVALASLAVHEAYRARGIGTSLVLHGLDRCRAQGVGAVWVQGSARFYGRLGFRLLKKAWPKIRSPWLKHKHDMGLELIPGTLAHAHGSIVYPPEAWTATMDVPAALASISMASSCRAEVEVHGTRNTAARESEA